MFMDQKTQCCQDIIYSQLGPQIPFIPNQNSSRLFCGYWQTDYKLDRKRQKNQNSYHNTEGEKQFGGLTLPDFKPCHKIATLIKIVWYWQKERQIDKWDRRESPEIDLHKYSQWTFGEGTKAIQYSEDSTINKWCWNNWTPTCKNKKY